jgi:hypothetical protein
MRTQQKRQRSLCAPWRGHQLGLTLLYDPRADHP